MPEIVPNVGKDPINPAYYDGDACARIIEHMPANIAFAVKYAWRFGEKDNGPQEAKKAIWYLEREIVRSPRIISIGTWYSNMAGKLIKDACKSGKLNLWRSELIAECVVYTEDGVKRHLERAIQLFESYGVNDADHQQ